MKKALSCALFVLIATSMVSPALGAADETKSKSPAKAPAKAAVKKPRPLPFHGRVSKVDAKAQTLTVGKRVFHLNDTTNAKAPDGSDAYGTSADSVAGVVAVTGGPLGGTSPTAVNILTPDYKQLTGNGTVTKTIN